MNSINFPKMFTTTTTKVVKEYDATSQDLVLLLKSEKGELIGDPFFGIRLKRYIFNQNSSILRDVLIDEIYSQLLVFAPQLTLTREDIKIEHVGNRLIAKIKAINKVDFTTNMYQISLFTNEER